MGEYRYCVSDRMGWNIITGIDVGNWVAERVQGNYHDDDSEAIGLEREGKIIAGVIYENYNGRSIFCHLAVERMNKVFLNAIFDYPFMVCDVKQVYAPTLSDNHRQIKILYKMGFVEESRLKDSDDNGDLIFFKLEKKNCKYIRS